MLRNLVLRFVINAVALAAAAALVPGINYHGNLTTLALAAIIFGLINALIRPLVLLVALPITCLTLGLFTLVINALMLWLVSAFEIGFTVTDFWSAFLGAIVVSLVSILMSSLFHTTK
jgi:putative membrane protein